MNSLASDWLPAIIGGLLDSAYSCSEPQQHSVKGIYGLDPKLYEYVAQIYSSLDCPLLLCDIGIKVPTSSLKGLLTCLAERFTNINELMKYMHSPICGLYTSVA